MAQEADIPLSAAELEVRANENNVCILKNGPYSLCTLPQVIRKQYLKEGEYVTIQTKFNYAWGLIRSTDPEQIELGIQLLTGSSAPKTHCFL